jgi:hypothetical protein
MIADPIRTQGMANQPVVSVRSPDRSAGELPTWEPDRLVVPDVVIPVVTREHLTPAVAVLHTAQWIVSRVLSKVTAPATLEVATLSAICNAALSERFGEPGLEGAPSLNGPSQTSWQLIQVAEHLIRRKVELSVIERAMDGALR